MNSIVCTLFEGHYHLGVAALVNSLCKNGFRGDVYVGYKGALPSWIIDKARVSEKYAWDGNKVLVSEYDGGLRLIFLEIKEGRHMAHYKPEFMLKLMKEIAVDASHIAYFDPDITIKSKWAFFEKWSGYGVAMVHEIVSNDMPPTHPTRKAWEIVINDAGKKVNKQLSSYLNCGFCMINRNEIEFLKLWKFYIDLAIAQYGQDPKTFSTFDRTATFWSIDQDTFNMAAMSCESAISEMGPEGMDFIHGGWTMSHATGSSKPWRKNYFKSFINGNPPSIVDKEFWGNMVSGIIHPVNSGKARLKVNSLKVYSLLGRFYRRY